jgi:hypothetical protein
MCITPSAKVLKAIVNMAMMTFKKLIDFRRCYNHGHVFHAKSIHDV